MQSVEEGDDQFLPASSCASGGAEAALAGGAAGASAELQQKSNLVEQPGECPLSTIGSANGLCQAEAALRMKPPPCLFRSHAPTTKQVVRAAFPSTA